MVTGVMRGDLLLLHGFTQTGRAWAPVVDALGERYRCVAPDLPGHGLASERRPATFDGVSAWVRAFKPPRFALAGYSMGGRLALHAALALQQRITRLVLVGASPGIADAQERDARAAADRALADRIEAEGLEAFVDEWGKQPLFAGQPRAIATFAREDRLRGTAAGYAAALRGMGTGEMQPLWERLGDLTMPVTLIAGERDEKFRALAEEMAAAITDARVVVVPNAGHAVQLEQPHAVAEAIAGTG